MKNIQAIINLLSTFKSINSVQVNKYLKFNHLIQLFSGNSKLLEINENAIQLCERDITKRILATYDKLNKDLADNKWSDFLSELNGSLLRLNHLGISYACNDFESEILYYKKLLVDHDFSFYEEPSDNANSKWLFIGDTSDWQSPLFEVVLTKNVEESENIWRPHFQIDIDTSLSPDELQHILSKYFGNDFIQWKLNIPNYGIVLDMGMLCSVNGTKIYLGIGTNLRNTQYHRKNILKKL